MKIIFLIIAASVILLFTNCQDGKDDPKDLPEIENEEVVLEGIDDTTWINNDDYNLFSIDIPNRMKKMNSLNPEAELQYGFVQKIEEEVLEHYLVVLVETKAGIDSFNLDFEFDAMSYRDISIESLGENLEDFKILTTNPIIEEVNGIDCVMNRAEGKMVYQEKDKYGTLLEMSIDVYYMLGVFEGENAFYQVLTWCIADQQNKFKNDMDRLIRSFKEKE